MVKESYALLTGLFVLALGAATVILGFFLGDYGEVRDRYLLDTAGAVSGLNAESEVIYRGVKAGKVIRIGFDPDDPRNIQVLIEVNRGLPITRGTYAQLRVQPLTGLAQVELNDDGDHPQPLVTDDENPAHMPIRPSLFDRLTLSGDDILQGVAELARRFNALLGDEQILQIQRAIARFDQNLMQLASLETRIGESLDRVPELDRRLRKALEEHAAAARAVRDSALSVERLAAGAQGVVSQLEREQLPQWNHLTGNLDALTRQLQQLSAKLERDPQLLLTGPRAQPPGPGEPGYRETR